MVVVRNTENWFKQASVESTTLATVSGSDPRPVGQYSKLVITVYCDTAPDDGDVAVKVQQSHDYNKVESPHWEDIAVFDAFSEDEDSQTIVVNAFHSNIRALALNSVDAMTSSVSIYIREML